MSKPETFLSSHGTKISYYKVKGRSPTVVFMGGFMSDMEGSKATFLEQHCSDRGYSFVRFDYQGHGSSSGDFSEGTIGIWTQDALSVVDNLTQGPLILVGSSMGGWISFLCAKARPGRVKALIGIAAAPDFTTRMWKDDLTEDQRQEILSNGLVKIPTDYGPEPYIITRNLIRDGYKNRVIHQPLHLDVPIRLIQGTEDQDVPWDTALKISEKIQSSDLDIILVPGGDHSLSKPRDLARLGRVTDEMVELTSL